MKPTLRMPILLLLILLPVAPSAASDCFCLQDEAMNIRYGCGTQGQGYRSRTFCLDENSREFIMDDPDFWTRLEAGQGRRDPCRPERSPDGPIRGEDDDTAIALFTALVHVAGWTYAYHYFGYFSLGLLQLEITQDYYFIA